MTILDQYPPVKYRFVVTFLVGGVVPNPVDIRFQKVSGISAEVKTEAIREGGENHYVHQLPTGIEHDNLTLERGVLMGSPLTSEFSSTLTFFKFNPGNVLVTLLGKDDIPNGAWLFLNAYPRKWKLSDLDATSNDIMIESMELAYTRFLSI